MNWLELKYNLQSFMTSGGMALWGIALVMLLLWLLIIERYLFLFQVYPKLCRYWISQWQARPERTSWHAHRIRELLVSQANLSLKNGLAMLKVLVTLCPLLGLWGTVNGMIEVFDTMAVLGTGNARAMASGISRATLPTLAGMVAALPGLYFYSQLQQRVEWETHRLLDRLTH